MASAASSSSTPLPASFPPLIQSSTSANGEPPSVDATLAQLLQRHPAAVGALVVSSTGVPVRATFTDEAARLHYAQLVHPLVARARAALRTVDEAAVVAAEEAAGAGVAASAAPGASAEMIGGDEDAPDAQTTAAAASTSSTTAPTNTHPPLGDLRVLRLRTLKHEIIVAPAAVGGGGGAGGTSGAPSAGAASIDTTTTSSTPDDVFVVLVVQASSTA